MSKFEWAWREIRFSPRRHYLGKATRDYAFCVRNGMNSDVWDAVVYGHNAGGPYKTLREAKAACEKALGVSFGPRQTATPPLTKELTVDFRRFPP